MASTAGCTAAAPAASTSTATSTAPTVATGLLDKAHINLNKGFFLPGLLAPRLLLLALNVGLLVLVAL